MNRLLYTLTVIALLPWAVVHLLWRARRQRDYLWHWGERFAFYRNRNEDAQPVIWLHAVSVGETRAAQPLVAALRTAYPGHRIVFTHMTPTGRATSEALFGDSVERLYLPYDLPWAMQRFLRRYRPRFGLIMETELWPNLVTACRAQSVPLLLVNARLSARSAARYARFASLTRIALQGLTAISAQSADDAARLAALGGRDIQITGNLKFDAEVPEEQADRGRHLRGLWGPRPVWLAASTREGEEALILDAWLATPNRGEALLVIVPRHPQRFGEVAALARQRGFVTQVRSDDIPIAAETAVVIGDSMGEMFAYYLSADLAFIGGSLLDYGSQNLIEAAACGTPILIGPSTRNFFEAAREALACGAAVSIESASQLTGRATSLLGDDARRAAMAIAGKEFAARHRGATARTLELITRAVR